MSATLISAAEAEPLLYLLATGGTALRGRIGMDFSDLKGAAAVAAGRSLIDPLAALGLVTVGPGWGGQRRAMVEITEKGRIAAAILMVKEPDLAAIYLDGVSL